ncbi:tRNA (5-methylaminomethyl-2-thiouridine)(34)-methyltransferase MnmD [Bacteroides sp. OttesenSCG-928-J23]|nr:tRNA (5-methylaminomethyl-2-thiouridine)(34)-methyltransferase MnmD [Bacteroides sp. OttesenSCG-928-N06]MDL2247504.1 tRNA (5-methylaminomethyl-2-thiouridine)(34)-methyltransferase MnmD [Bacteroides sp. OttesenSCG-928-J23]MDL2304512.1 tRNA (5-methylaminomethyl-2-thiouridine)(34)-methyltransferase MnmD [Bacteroides sp. OttesenSCG-928-D19]
MERIIEHTADGSSTLYIPRMDEHYHSVKGAETESRHIFIEMGMKQLPNSQPIHIFEVGFGTGLNTWLSFRETQQGSRRVHYTTIELYPLDWNTVEALGYSDHPAFKQIHETPWNEAVEITPHFVLHKINANFTQYHFEEERIFDVVYFDAFAPEKQPGMWNQQIFDNLYRWMTNNSVLTTYCAKGVVRRMLQQSGFIVERLPGPPGGKREILRARKNVKHNIE